MSSGLLAQSPLNAAGLLPKRACGVGHESRRVSNLGGSFLVDRRRCDRHAGLQRGGSHSCYAPSSLVHEFTANDSQELRDSSTRVLGSMLPGWGAWVVGMDFGETGFSSTRGIVGLRRPTTRGVTRCLLAPEPLLGELLLLSRDFRAVFQCKVIPCIMQAELA